MQNPHLFLLPLVAAACIAVPIAVICSRRRLFETWAKAASILLCVFGLGWTTLAFSLIRMGDAASGPSGVALSHARTFCLGLILGILIARPWKKVTSEKSQTVV